MKQKKIFVCTVCLKFSFFLLLFSLMLFPRFFWRSDEGLSSINSAIRKKESLEQFNEKGATPLIGAAAQGRIEIAKKLLDAGAKTEVHANNPEDIILEAGNTALHYSLLNGHYEMLKLLINHGANIFSINYNKNTPLYTLINSVDTPIETKEKCIDLLIKKSKNNISRLFNAQNKQGYTPLMRAAELRDEGLVALILKKAKKHINYLLKNNDSLTAIGVAKESGADDTTIALIKKAQDLSTKIQKTGEK